MISESNGYNKIDTFNQEDDFFIINKFDDFDSVRESSPQRHLDDVRSRDIGEESEINLLQLSRLYTIGQIPIMDFIVLYLILYVLNFLCFQCNYKLILVSTIPLVIIFNLLINKDMKMTWTLFIILIVTISYLFYNYVRSE